MLILQRKLNKQIDIGDDITVRVLKIAPDRHGELVVSLGVDAPRHVRVDRHEISKARLSKLDRVVPDR